MIVRSACHFSSSRSVPLSRELDPFFRSEVRKAPVGNGRREPRARIEHLARLRAVVCTMDWTGPGSPRQSGPTIRIKIGRMSRFGAGRRARLAEHILVRAPRRPGEPQSTGGCQRRHCQRQMFCFHWFLPFDSRVTFTLATALCADF